MSDLTDLLHRLAEAIHRPSDHPLDELSAAVDALEGAPEAKPAESAPAPQDQPSEADTPAPVFQGTESAPETPAAPAGG